MQTWAVSTSDVITTSRLIPAPASAIFELLARPALHSVIDGSGSVRGVQQRTPERMTPGGKFGMRMKIGLPYKILLRVEEFEEGRLISWRHPAEHVWRYRLDPVDEQSTMVTEEFDFSEARAPWMIKAIGAPKRNLRSMQQTLVRMEEWARSGHPIPEA